jgi:hypothetical protein
VVFGFAYFGRMRRVLLVLFLAGSGAVSLSDVVASPGHAALSQTTGPLAVCSITKLRDDGIGYGIRALGSCEAKGKSVPGTWTWTRTTSDVTGATCGATGSRQSGHTNLADETETMYKLAVAFTLAPKDRAGRSARKVGTFVLGSTLNRCADLSTFSVPAASTICPWEDTDALKRWGVATCGTPTTNRAGDAKCSWLGPATMSSDGHVSAGAFACAGGDCTSNGVKPIAHGFFGLPAFADGDFVCGFVLNKGYAIGPSILITTVKLVDNSGRSCGGLVLEHRAWISGGLTIPATYGGSLYVTFGLHSGLGTELETASFKLRGTADCSTFSP